MSVFAKPSDIAPIPKREAGGDNEVPRTKKGQPRIVLDCWVCDGTGKVPSEKVEGRLNKCPSCGPKKDDEATADLPMGKRLKPYTRTTTYIDCIEDKSNLQAWGERMVLIGVARDTKFLNDVLDLDARREEKDAKDELNRKAQAAKQKAGAEEKADQGTHLHGLSELVDEGKLLPPLIPFEDVVDMDSYRRATVDFQIVHMEKLVVHDEFLIAGTPDRVSRWIGERELVAPDGDVIGRDELLITDLKTGTVEYGALKMAMQLSIYSRSKLYDYKTGERSDLGKINQKWGVIMNLPAGSGECTLYWADLTLGWEAVQVAKAVRELRSKSSSALQVLLCETSSVGQSV